MVWSSMEEWEDACNEKMNDIKSSYKKISGNFNNIYNFLDERSSFDFSSISEVKEFSFLIKKTVDLYIIMLGDDDLSFKNWVKKIKQADNYYKENKDSLLSEFNNFINDSWKYYKKLKNTVGKSIVNFKEIASENGNTSSSLNESLEDLQKKYFLYSNEISKKLKKDVTALKSLGEDCGVVRVAKLQRWFLSSNSNFGILHFLDISLKLIDKVGEVYNNNKSENERYNSICKIVCEKETFENVKNINDFYDENEYSLIRVDKLLSRFKSSVQHEPESLRSLFKFKCYIEKQGLDKEIKDLVNDAIEFYKKEISDQKANQKKINSEMKYVFRYIIKKINKICSNLKKEYKKKYLISDYAMNDILDFVKTKIISEFLDESKFDTSESVKGVTKVVGVLVGTAVFFGIMLGNLAALTSVSAISIILASFVATSTLLSPFVAVVAGMWAVPAGCFFYKSFKNFQHRKIRNKFKKFMKTKKQQNNSNDQPAALPMNLDSAETPTPDYK